MIGNKCLNCSTDSDCQSDLSMRSSVAIMSSTERTAQSTPLRAYRSAGVAET